MELKYKIATKDDIPALVLVEESVTGSPTYSPMLDASEWEEAFKNGTVYVVQSDGKVIGDASYEPRGTDGFYISGIVVGPKFQGKGIGKMILQKLLDDLKDAKRIELVTHPDNAAALKLYQTAGFVIESRKENFYGDGEPRLLLYWTPL